MDQTSTKTRIDLVDLLRGVALIAMTLFHFGWDLEMLGFVERGFASQPAMIWFARCIASFGGVVFSITVRFMIGTIVLG